MHNELSSLLNINGLVTGYGNKQVLNGITLNIDTGEIIALIGHNGAGKSTLLKAIFGLVPIWKGQLALEGRILSSLNPRELLRAGISYVPQGNRVFTELTVRENLQMASTMLTQGVSVNEKVELVFDLFPALKSRLRQRAGTLSGGEKQMLAVSNALIVSPKLLLLDEPSLGLASPLVTKTLGLIQQINHNLGVTILIVEQKVREVLKIARRVYVLRNGQVSFTGTVDDISDDLKLREVYL